MSTGTDRTAAADSSLPSVSVVVPARNCADVIAGCLDALGRQSYRGPMDVTVAVAPSADGTEQMLADTAVEFPIQVVENRAGTTPAGLNAAVAACDGTIVARVDAQSRLPPYYIARAVATMARTGAANVGGVQRPVASDGTAGAIAAAMGSRFGGGPAAFRQGGREGPVDTVYLGVFDRAALAAVGGFDETLERNQDYELNWRLRQQGFTVWLDPELEVDYLPRSSLAGLARQYFAYGAWKRTVLLRHPRSLRPRQLAAPALTAALAASAVELARGRLRGLAAPLLYAGACAVAASRLRPRLPAAWDRARAGWAFAVIHVGWGLGFLAGRARRAVRGRERR